MREKFLRMTKSNMYANNIKYFYKKKSSLSYQNCRFQTKIILLSVLFIGRCRPWWTPQGIPFLDDEGIAGKIFETLTIS